MQGRLESCDTARTGRTLRASVRRSWPLGCAVASLLAACTGAQSKREPAPSSPAYTTSGSPDQATHTMPGATTMPGHQHGEPGAGQHVMPDGGTMSGDQHPPGETHVMPDGTVMPGAHHGAPPN